MSVGVKGLYFQVVDFMGLVLSDGTAFLYYWAFMKNSNCLVSISLGLFFSKLAQWSFRHVKITELSSIGKMRRISHSVVRMQTRSRKRPIEFFRFEFYWIFRIYRICRKLFLFALKVFFKFKPSHLRKFNYRRMQLTLFCPYCHYIKFLMFAEENWRTLAAVGRIFIASMTYYMYKISH